MYSIKDMGSAYSKVNTNIIKRSGMVSMMTIHVYLYETHIKYIHKNTSCHFMYFIDTLFTDYKAINAK